MTRICEERL